MEVTGGPLLEGSSQLPIVGLLRKGEKKVIGVVRSEQTVSTNWRWKPVVIHPDEASNVNGVILKRRHLGGKRFEFEVNNTKSFAIAVEITFTGSGASGIFPNPARRDLRGGEIGVVISAELNGQLGMEWKWDEIK